MTKRTFLRTLMFEALVGEDMGIPKTKSVTALRDDLYETLRKVANGQPLLVTQKQGDNIVLLSQKDYNKILEECELLRAVASGVEDIESKKVVGHESASKRLRKLQAKWK